MANCVLCGKIWGPLHLDPNGVCPLCRKVEPDNATALVQVVLQSIAMIDKSHNLETQLSNLMVIENQCKELLKYEKAGIPTLTPVPSQILIGIPAYKSELVARSARLVSQEAVAKLTADSTFAQKARMLIRAQEKLCQLGARHGENETIAGEVQRLHGMIHDLKYNDLLERAVQAEVRGQKKRALSAFREVVYFLRNDPIEDSLQELEISYAESKIRDIEGRE